MIHAKKTDNIKNFQTDFTSKKINNVVKTLVICWIEKLNKKKTTQVDQKGLEKIWSDYKEQNKTRNYAHKD